MNGKNIISSRDLI